MITDERIREFFGHLGELTITPTGFEGAPEMHIRGKGWRESYKFTGAKSFKYSTHDLLIIRNEIMQRVPELKNALLVSEALLRSNLSASG